MAPLSQHVAQRTAPEKSFLEEVLDGLRRPAKRLACKYFYDERGSELFEQICELQEYDLRRTELKIMERYGAKMAALVEPASVVLELGSGSGRKTRVLLEHLQEPSAYVPIDIAREQLEETARQLADEFPRLAVRPICADFALPFTPPSLEPRAPRLVYFPGSTIGNFARRAAIRFLKRIAKLCGTRGKLLIGIDLKKPREVLEAAYNDASGVTAAFNLNLLQRINRELGADFDVNRFQHRAEYNERRSRIEMFLISQAEQQVCVAGESINFAPGERICTEYSHKYTVQEFASLAEMADLDLMQHWTDESRHFAVLLMQPRREMDFSEGE